MVLECHRGDWRGGGGGAGCAAPHRPPVPQPRPLPPPRPPLPQLLVGVVYNPITDELFSAVKGGGATLNGVPLHTSGAAGLATALVGTEIGTSRDPAVMDAAFGRAQALTAAARSLRCGGSCALGLCGVAAGRLDAFYEIGFGGPWDVAAGACILREAGGVVLDPAGGPFTLGGRRVLGAAQGVAAAAAAESSFLPC